MRKTSKIKEGDLDRERQFRAKERLHISMAKIPFDQKMAIWWEMRRIAYAIKGPNLRFNR